MCSAMGVFIQLLMMYAVLDLHLPARVKYYTVQDDPRLWLPIHCMAIVALALTCWLICVMPPDGPPLVCPLVCSG